MTTLGTVSGTYFPYTQQDTMVTRLQKGLKIVDTFITFSSGCFVSNSVTISGAGGALYTTMNAYPAQSSTVPASAVTSGQTLVFASGATTVFINPLTRIYTVIPTIMSTALPAAISGVATSPVPGTPPFQFTQAALMNIPNSFTSGYTSWGSGVTVAKTSGSLVQGNMVIITSTTLSGSQTGSVVRLTSIGI
jgi:hypothetical protein